MHPGVSPVVSRRRCWATVGHSAELESEIGEVARRLADEHGHPVRCCSPARTSYARAEAPPIAGGMNADGTGLLRVARTPGIVEAIARVTPDVTVEEVDVVGPPTSAAIAAPVGSRRPCCCAARRGRLDCGADRRRAPLSPPTARSEVQVRAGDPLDETTLRSYCTGAAHMGLGLVRSESIAVDPETGEIHDLTIRSFGVFALSIHRRSRSMYWPTSDRLSTAPMR